MPPKPFPAVATALLLTAAAAALRSRRGNRQDPPAPAAAAFDGGRGRTAATPGHIPWAGWKDILLRTTDEVQNDRLLAVAAGVVFYGLLALFPTISAFVSLYGLFADVNTVSSHLDLLATVAPGDVVGLVREQVQRIASAANRELGLAFLVSFVLALWSANAGMKAMFDALNVAYNEKEERGLIKLNLVSLAFTFASIVLLLLAIGGLVALPGILSALGLPPVVAELVAWLRWPVLFIVVAIALSVLYRFGPSRRHPQWKWVTAGSTTAAALWLVGSALFSLYLSHFANFNATYGSLGAVVGLMMWLWLTSIAVLLGAELNAEIERQTARDTTEGGGKPLGMRGARMADTIGAARAA